MDNYLRNMGRKSLYMFSRLLSTDRKTGLPEFSVEKPIPSFPEG